MQQQAQSIAKWIEHNFGVMLFSAAFIGLFMPYVDRIPDFTLVVLLGLQLFCSCFRIHWSDLRKIKPFEFAGMYVLRFIVFPAVLYLIVAPFLPEYKNALFLLAMIPSGVTLPVVIGVCGGHVLTGLTATVVTSALAPFVIPIAFEYLSDTVIELDTIGMFKTLCFVVFAPTALYFLVVRKTLPKFCEVAKPYTGASAILLMFCAIIIVISKIKDLLLSDFATALTAVSLAFGFYLLLYIAGWIIFAKKPFDERLTYAFITGNNNIMLALTLALLFLPRQEVVMLAFGEFAWISGVSFFQMFLLHYRKRFAVSD